MYNLEQNFETYLGSGLFLDFFQGSEKRFVSYAYMACTQSMNTANIGSRNRIRRVLLPLGIKHTFSHSILRRQRSHVLPLVARLLCGPHAVGAVLQVDE